MSMSPESRAEISPEELEELEEWKTRLLKEKHQLKGRVRILREALVMIDKHPTNGNSEPDSMAEALEQIHALAEAALEATKEGA